MTFDDWFGEQLEQGFLLPYEECRDAYEAGWNALAELTDGPTYEEVISHERSSV